MTTDDTRPDVGDAVQGEPAPEPRVESSEPGQDERRKRRHLPIWQETLLLLGSALVLAIVIKSLFLQAFYIPSESMEPGLVKDDRILVQKVSYWFGGEPERGDVVVFEDPGGWLAPTEEVGPDNPLTEVLAKIGLYPTGGHLVKRVIGVAGDTISCCDDEGRLLLNGEPLEETEYILDDAIECNGPMPQTCDTGGWTAGPVPDGTVFVMGDNRAGSADSTVHMDCLAGKATDCTDSPYVDTDLVVGKVLVVVWPRENFRWVQRPESSTDVPDAS